MSPITQILVEKCISGWKEIEFETMRDARATSSPCAPWKTLDPVGIHTGDSIVAAPALTLSDREFQMLRTASLDIISELGIVGGCNVQLALNPDSFEYAVIEVNPRVSTFLGAGLQGHGLPHCQDNHQDRSGLHSGRDKKRHHRQDLRLLRAHPGLCGGEAPQVALRQIRRLQP
jgi:hypothetical protein